MDRTLSVAERQKFSRYHSRITPFVQNVLCADHIDLRHYIPGSRRIEYYPSRFQTFALEIEDYVDDPEEPHSYEEALYRRLVSPTGPNLLVLIGGLGAGKSTTVRYMEDLLAQHQDEIRTVFPCSCTPTCLRRPIKIDNLDVRRKTPLKQLQTGILRAIRFQIYNRLIEEWLVRNSISPEIVSTLDPTEYKVLRRLLIVNDISAYADEERGGFYPVNVHSDDLALDKPLLKTTVSIEAIAGIVDRFRRPANRITDPLLAYTSDPEQALEFTSVVIGFYLSRCSFVHPNNLLIIDNLDHLLTKYIEEIVQQMHSIVARNKGMRVLIPLRPSSIVPHGFVHDVNYMYHYGPDCFEMILDRVQRGVLSRSCDELTHDAYFPPRSADDELKIFLIVIYIYAVISSTGMRFRKNKKRAAEHVADDHHWLKHLHLGERTVRNLSQTLDALVGTSARYAITQFRRYLSSSYHEPWLLRDILHRGVTSGALTRMRLHYNFLIVTILGDWEREGDRTRLANLYKATTSSANPGWPSLIKLRILTLLSHSERVLVAQVLDDLAQFGIPAERAIESLNYLSDKYRLLLWFSSNSNLAIRAEDLKQYVVIAEHGLGYLYNVAGDFEYIWFCARQVPRTTVPLSEWAFHNRLDEYFRIVTALGNTEWKQLAFRYCSSTTLVMRTEKVDKGELLTLWLLLSSLERALGASEYVLRQGRSGELRELVATICRLVLFWAERYNLLFGGNGYTSRYEKLISIVSPSLRRLADGAKLDEAEQVLALWRQPLANYLFSWYGRTIPAPPPEEFMAKIKALGRGVIPIVPQFGEVLEKMEMARLLVWHFVKERRALGELLDNSLPSFAEIQRMVSSLQERAESVVHSLGTTSGAPTETIDWFMEEYRWLKDYGSQLEDNRFAIPTGRVCEMAEMDTLKTRFNNIMTLFSRLAKRLGAERTAHLDVFWQ